MLQNFHGFDCSVGSMNKSMCNFRLAMSIEFAVLISSSALSCAAPIVKGTVGIKDASYSYIYLYNLQSMPIIPLLE